MKKKIVSLMVVISFIAVLLFAEYRYIMHNIRPYTGNNGSVYLEVFGQVDEYHAEEVRWN